MSRREPRPRRAPTLADALIPLIAMVVLIGGSLLIFGLGALDGPIQVALIASCLVAAVIALKNGYQWGDVQAAGQSAMGSITSAVFILLAVGALIGTWNLSGTIPTLVSYGLAVLSPSWFYAATAVICGIVAMSIGSSWTTAGTIGVGLVGIGAMLGVSPAITAGAVISGAYLGDKLSPLSETTILTAQMVKIDVMRHIRAQAWTSLPAFAIAVVVFLVLGLTTGGQAEPPAPTEVELEKLAEVFHITPWNLLPLVLLVVLSVRRVPAPMALFLSAVFAGITGAILQPQVFADFIGQTYLTFVGGIEATWQAMATGFSTSTGIADIDRLLSRGGMDSMMLTLWLIIGAVTFGALMDELGLISRITDPLIARAKSRGALYLTVFASAFGLNIVAGDQYIALVLPARTYRAEFAKRGLAPTNLSRLCADSGTVTSPLVPWNSCGAFMGSTLGVGTLLYLPFAFFNIFSPLLSLIYGFTGFKVEKAAPEDVEAAGPEDGETELESAGGGPESSVDP
ncbi:MAG: Na+/H+ antiporter NhaC [Candidatus Leucobacter sulfamidivorax]|nr:Na+/H+ antiporter NhaC [Candidatus Leucobacter sulfamidivorax]